MIRSRLSHFTTDKLSAKWVPSPLFTPWAHQIRRATTSTTISMGNKTVGHERKKQKDLKRGDQKTSTASTKVEQIVQAGISNTRPSIGPQKRRLRMAKKEETSTDGPEKTVSRLEQDIQMVISNNGFRHERETRSDTTNKKETSDIHKTLSTPKQRTPTSSKSKAPPKPIPHPQATAKGQKASHPATSTPKQDSPTTAKTKHYPGKNDNAGTKSSGKEFPRSSKPKGNKAQEFKVTCLQHTHRILDKYLFPLAPNHWENRS
ncbi:hypothetical protein BJ508DRAFT_24392 [Ascobolus immersus RN42]|uniref:Uncharacterized protein n=1 Tax=Ascobolus immersus RN42 TaxID=1160509 RepID=A0A3N4HMU1_ASCIM|nr:hypothetical protein BJ508DRAFT_24392 [Ascobolus immersus RN42]